MNKFHLIVLFLVCCIHAEVTVKNYIQFYFPANMKGDWYESCFENDISPDEFDPLSFTDLDSNVFYTDVANDLGNEYDDELYMTFWVLSTSTHPFKETLRYQLNQFYECGLFDLPKERADVVFDSVVTFVDSVMQSYPPSFIYEYNCYKNEEEGPCHRTYSSVYIPGELNQEIARQNAAISAIPQKRRTVKDPLERYRLFDLNGRFIWDVDKRSRMLHRVLFAR
ncbi:MAG: hypothetical protein IKZ45_07910 [Fibrobacter sp.]|nr:hypothetical protein [Fibrobacter sp.]